MNTDTEDTTIYNVVVNHEEQYSIWPAYKDLPPGWTAPGRGRGGMPGLYQGGLVDMRPLSLRRRWAKMHRWAGETFPRIRART